MRGKPNQKPEILKFCKHIMVVLGLWRSKLTENTFLDRIYLLYSVCIHIYLFLLIFSMCTWVSISITHKNKSQEEIERIMTAITYLINMFVIMLKVILCETKGIRRTLEFVQEEEKKINQSESEDILDTHLENVKFCNRVNSVLAVSYIVLYVCFALIENTLARIKTGQYNKIHNETLTKPLIYDVYLYKINPIRYETIIMLYEYVAAAIFLAFNLSNNVILSCIIFASSMIKSLQIKLRKTGNEVLTTLKKNAQEHQQLIRFVEELNELLKYLILIEYSTISLNIALAALRFIQDDTLSMRIGSLFYSGSFAIYILALGWSSNEIRLQSMAIADAIYDSNWYNQDEEAKRILFMMMMRAKKPLHMTRGPFDEMTLQSAVTVTFCQTKGVRNAFAYVEEEEEKMMKSEDQDILKAHSKQVNFCNTVTTILATFYLLLYVCFALIENTLARLKIKQYNEMHNETLIKPLIYEVYLYKVNPIKYETIIMLYEYFGGVILLAFSLSTNAMLSCIMFALSMIKVLQIKIRRMTDKDQDAIIILKNNAQEHQRFIRFLENLNELLKYLILIEYSTISLNIALVALRFLQVFIGLLYFQDDTPTMRIGRIFFSGAFIVYILALGWSSNEIKLQSMAIADAIYDTPWYDQSEEAKRILLIMMMRTKRPLRMTKGPFDDMTLESAVTVLKGAYTYVTIMA
ncbi:uncharacterized protein LOC132704277 isoform X2 [Cylas formicarius]|uniref:uncharacterized protein LOC132704277 isoform X2 n=1 Tax=Cylas formicarius TaxID=197179 RepID=UPI0029586574|nr:uncharacterized protein LOC132704277 isoform X2 [Cylas formicarius]